MKSTLVSTLTLLLMIGAGAYAQDTTAAGAKGGKPLEQSDRKTRIKDELKEAGQRIGEAARKVGKVAKEKAKVADEEVSKGAKKVGNAVNKGLDKAENAIRTEGEKLKTKRDSSRGEKARRSSL